MVFVDFSRMKFRRGRLGGGLEREWERQSGETLLYIPLWEFSRLYIHIRYFYISYLLALLYNKKKSPRPCLRLRPSAPGVS
jgi:hypothetical protein